MKHSQRTNLLTGIRRLRTGQWAYSPDGLYKMQRADGTATASVSTPVLSLRARLKTLLSASGYRLQLACAVLAVSGSSLSGQAQAGEALKMLPSANSIESADFAQVIDSAEKLAKQAYVENSGSLPQLLLDIHYQQYRSIRFDPEQSLWHGQSDYEIQLFHPGFLYRKPVQIMRREAGQSPSQIPFEPKWFRYEGEAAHLQGLDKSNVGYAGFRVHYPINTQDYKDEFAVFLGASYFRLVGAGQNYGLSARGLAINTADASGEEFPRFTRFWLQKPQTGEPMVILALLDSPSLSAAYRFVLRPGLDTTMQIEAHLFARKNIKKLGIAPLTSMFLFGENSRHPHDDFRMEVHDSDGLLMQTSQDEWIWRPLTNPQYLQVTGLSDNHPKGFGLLQRDTNFEHYLDAEANYERRPGMWVVPEGDWGAGHVELVEIPTDSETNDNIVSYWVSDKPMLAGDSRQFSYRLSTVSNNPQAFKHSQVLRTRQGASVLPGVKPSADKIIRRFVVDFDATGMEELDPASPPQADLQVINGTAMEVKLLPILGGKAWRVTFLLVADSSKTADMRLFIKSEQLRLTEVWNYVWKHNANN